MDKEAENKVDASYSEPIEVLNKTNKKRPIVKASKTARKKLKATRKKTFIKKHKRGSSYDGLNVLKDKINIDQANEEDPINEVIKSDSDIVSESNFELKSDCPEMDNEEAKFKNIQKNHTKTKNKLKNRKTPGKYKKRYYTKHAQKTQNCKDYEDELNTKAESSPSQFKEQNADEQEFTQSIESNDIPNALIAEEEILQSEDSTAAVALVKFAPQDSEKVADKFSQAIDNGTAEAAEEKITSSQKLKTPEQASDKIIKKYGRIIITGIIFFALIITYIGFAQYFKNHFYFGTSVNGIDISGKSLQNAKEKLQKSLDNYFLTIIQRDDKTEKINSEDIRLKYNSLNDLKDYLNEQNGYGWIGAIFSNNSKKTIVMSFDENMLSRKIDELNCFKSENVIEPKSPGFKYTSKGYEIENEIKGCKVDKDELYKNVADAVCFMQINLDIDSKNCYIEPKYNTKSQKTIDIQNLLNKYVHTKITYIVGDSKKIIDASHISSWLSVDDDLNIITDNTNIRAFVDELSEIYKKCKYTRNFETTSSNTVKISGGDYGRYINKSKEINFINIAIKTGQPVIKNFNDIGGTYVEISLSQQHAWFYKKGSLIAHGPIVTGNVRQHNATPKGVYTLKYKSTNTTLKGRDYEVKVAYWMPFNGGIGMHDASWRGRFGGRIYRSDGSHGCVNMPYYMAKKIFQNISSGTPVVVY